MKRRILALLLALIMCLSAMPTAAFAVEGTTEETSVVTVEEEASTDAQEESTDEAEEPAAAAEEEATDAQEESTDEADEPAAAEENLVESGNSSDTTDEGIIDSGTCGDDLTWVLTEDGTLTISGTGDMTDYSSVSYAPWYDARESILKVVVEEGVTSVGNFSFFSCTNLLNAVISDGVTEMGFSTFYNCTDLTDISLPDSLESIGDYSFWRCSSLTEIEIPNGVTTIGAHTFIFCTGLVSIVLPDSLTSISGDMFCDCTSLTSVVIGNGTTSIGMYAFSGCSSMTDIAIGSGMSSIAMYAFSGCTSLTSIYYAGSTTEWDEITIYKTDNDSFLAATVYYHASDPDDIVDCGTCGDDLTWVLTEDGTLTITGTGAMTDYYNSEDPPWTDYRENITSVEFGAYVTSISNFAFYRCKNLTSVSISNSIEQIGIGVFDFCENLIEIIVDLDNEVYSSLNGVLFNKNQTELVSYPAGKDEISYTIPESVTSIGRDAFLDCNNLVSVEISESVTSIGDCAFYGCNNLVSVEIPESVTSIGSSAFYLCTSLESIIIPNNIKYIEGQTFGVCENLTSVTLGSGIISISESAFSNCSSLTEIMVKDGNTAYSSCDGVLFNKDQSELVCYPAGKAEKLYTIPESVTSISNNAFCRSDYLTGIIFQTDAPDISAYAFSGFVAAVYYPENNQTWTEDIMQDYSGDIIWISYEVESGTVANGVCGENLTWIQQNNGVLTIVGTGEMYNYEAGETPWYNRAIISIEYDGEITSIGDYAFYECSNLTSIIIPNSVDTIGTYAFAYCTKLAEADLGSQVTSIGTGAFWSDKLTYISLPDTLTWIGDSVFRECTDLISVTIPVNVSYIGRWVFGSCSSLEEITVAEGNAKYSSLDGILFNNLQTCLITYPCGKTSCNYSIPDGVVVIGEFAFSGCVNLVSITIPSSVKTIEQGAFFGCTNLSSITIPASVSTIRNGAFTQCTSLSEIVFCGNAPVFGNNDEANLFYNVTATAYYPSNDNTWTEEVMQDYDGTITWVPCKGAGTCGDNLTWLLTEDGTLTISGTGDMYDYINTDSSYAPWYDSYHGDVVSVIIEDGVTSIGNCAFSYCTNLTEVTLPDNLVSIGTRAFSGCTYLTEIILPENLLSIGRDAFFSCKNLRSITIPANVIDIGDRVFGYCTHLSEILVADGNTSFSSVGGVLFNYDQSELLQYPENKASTYTIPSSVISIGDYAFYYCTKLTDVSIPDSVAEIGDSAFYSCTGLDEITIPNGVTSIGAYAFMDTALTSVTIPSSVTSIGEYAFGYGSDNTLLDGFVIYGDKGSAAEAYANENGITFYRLPEQISDCTVTLSYTAISYNGSACEPKVTVKDGTTTLTQGTDYTVAYSNNVNAGTATVTVTGIGDYTGTTEVSFTIRKITQTLTTEISSDTLAVGETAQITATAEGAVRYTSSDTSIATVNSAGLVTAVAAGTVTITVKASPTDNYYSATNTIEITVTDGSTTPTIDAPVISSVYSTVQTSVKVTWTEVEGADGYQLYRATEEDGTYSCVKTISDGTTTSYTNSDLTVGQTYYYKVCAYTKDSSNNWVYSEFSDVRYMPAAVVFDNVYSNSTSRIRILWNEISGAEGYQIWRADSEDGEYKIVKTITSGDTTAYSNTGLESGKTYYYKMRAYTTVDDDTVFGVYSDVFAVAVTPEAPTLTVTSSSAGIAKLSWDEISGAAGYQIWRSDSETGTYTLVKSITSGSTTSYSNSGLTSGNTYYYKVRAYTEVDGKKTFGAYSTVQSVDVK